MKAECYTKLGYKIVQSCEVIFSQANEKNHCIAGTMELFFEAGLRKKNEQIGLFYIPFWYYTKMPFSYCHSILETQLFASVNPSDVLGQGWQQVSFCFSSRKK